MTAAEPPVETDSTQTTSPWRRLGPGWTLFDSTWGTERRDADDLDLASNGHAAQADGGGVAPPLPDAGADRHTPAPAPVTPPAVGVLAAAAAVAAAAALTPTATQKNVVLTDALLAAPVLSNAAASPSTAPVAPRASADVATALDPLADSAAEDAVTTDVLAGTERAVTIVPTSPLEAEDAHANGAVTVEATTEGAGRPAAPLDVAPRDAAHAESPPLEATTAVGVSTDVEASSGALVAAATTDAPEQRRRRRHAKRATRWTRVRLVVGLTVLACVLVCVGIGVVALVQGTWAINPVLSGSMRPGIAVGGVVISERVPVDQLALRDVIVFQDPLAPSEQIVHRIVEISVTHTGEHLFLTQGDANVSRDPWRLRIPGGTVYRMRWSVPLLGYVAIAYENHRGIVLIVAGGVLLLVAIPSFARARRRKVPEKTPA